MLCPLPEPPECVIVFYTVTACGDRRAARVSSPVNIHAGNSMGRNRRVRQQKSSPVVRYAVSALAVVVLLLGLATTRTANAHHPDPRADASSLPVDASSRYAAYPRIAQVYDMAAEIPDVLDGLYCHCDCSLHSNPRSLLTCFQSDHGAACDVCLTEAALAFRMNGEGRSLKEIRKAVDDLYRR
jgi:hypothetical protein